MLHKGSIALPQLTNMAQALQAQEAGTGDQSLDLIRKGSVIAHHLALLVFSLLG